MPTSCPPGSLQPRLLGLRDSAAYLGLSAWAIRALLDSGTLCRVRIPLPGGGELRRLLLDVRDLDQLVDRSREGRQERRSTGP
jgi:hypothetical protein